MSNSSNSELSATIANMMEVLNPTRARRRTELRTPLDFMSPLKRRLSSESIESPSDKRMKTDSTSSLDTSWLTSPRESRRMRAEVIELRSTIAGLENRIHHSHGLRKELQVMFDNEIRSHQLQHERDTKNIEALEEQVQSIRKREKEVKEELDQIKGTVDTSKLDYENQIEQMEITISKLQSELKMFESDEQDDMSKLHNRIEELEMVLDAAREDAQAQKDLASELEARLSKLSSVERDNEVKEQALLKAQLKVKDLEYTLESYGEWQAQSKIQQQKMYAYPDLEKEVQKLREDTRNLRDEVQNKLLLEEQVYDLQTRMKKFREQEKNFAKLQASHTHLENLVEEWRLLVRGFCETTVSDAMLPKQVRQCIEKLQQQDLSLTSEKVEMESLLKQSQHEAKLAKVELERSVKQVTDLQTLQQQHQALIHRLQKKLLLLSRERDSYRQQLDTYEKDLTISFAPGAQTTGQINAFKERIENLEKNIEGYREMINTLEVELRKNQPLLNTENLVPVRTEQVARLKDELEKLQSENQRLVERNDELEIRLEDELVGKDKVQGQVLHLKVNPLAEEAAETETTVVKLQNEVDRLKRKIKKMEDGLESSKLSESVCSSREAQTLREQVKSADIKNQRLKEYFKTSWNEFRDALYMLFGYKINRLSDNNFQLSSMYAEAPDDCIQFQSDSQGNMNLLATPYSSTLEDMIELHLRHQDSIPVFLSALTMDLFNRTTIISA